MTLLFQAAKRGKPEVRNLNIKARGDSTFSGCQEGQARSEESEHQGARGLCFFRRRQALIR